MTLVSEIRPDLEPNTDPRIEDRDELARDVLATVLVAAPVAQVAAIRRIPSLANPVLEFVRAAIEAAVDQHAPRTPTVIKAAAEKASIEVPPALYTDVVGLFHDLDSAARQASWLDDLIDQLHETLVSEQIAAYGRRVTSGAYRGSWDERIALLEQVGPLVDRCKRLMAAGR